MRTRPRVRRTARRCWTSSCRPVLGIAAALASFIVPVSAGEWEDCQSANDAKMVVACTAVIEKGDRNPQDRAKAHLRRGLDERQRGLLDQAWTDFDAAVKLDPGSSTAFFQRGVVSRQKGDIDHAASDFERAITLDPKNANAYVGRGNVRFMRRDVPGAFADFDQAIADLSRAVAINPNSAFYYSSRADAFDAKGDLDRALADYDRVLAISPADRHARDRRKAILAAKGEFNRVQAPASGAVASARPAPSAPAAADSVAPPAPTEPRSPTSEFDSAMSKANEALKAKQFAAAVEAFGRALALRPGHFDARAKRITALHGKGDSDQALSEAKQLSADSPDNAVAWGLLGDALQRKGEIEKTLAAYSRAIEIDPKYAGAFNARGT